MPSRGVLGPLRWAIPYLLRVHPEPLACHPTKGAGMRFTVTVTVSRIKVLAHKRRANVVAVREFILSPEDVQSARNWDRRLTREAVRQWLVLRIGDFAKVDDFCADLADGDMIVSRRSR